MLVYLVNFIHAFIPVTLVAGMLLALKPPCDVKRWRLLIAALLGGVLAGVAVYLGATHQGTLTAARTSLHASALVVALLNGVTLNLPSGGSRRAAVACQGVSLLFATMLTAAAAFDFGAFISERALTSSSVLNTELILNLAGISAGISLTAVLIPLAAQLSARVGRGVVMGTLLLVSALLVLEWGGDLLLGLMRLELVELTTLRVSIVARITKYAALFPYLFVLPLVVIALLYCRRRTRVGTDELATMEQALRRKARALVMRERRWLNCTMTCLAAVFSLLLYHDLYASRPPKISTPVNLKPEPDHMVRVKVDQLADGKLHRYSYIADDGHVVRYFMIRHPGGKKYGIVYDACLMCGDMGYIQEKNEVICIACNVRIFIPSIGKQGGCNPIPLAHELNDGQVIVAAEELDKGAKYFSEVVSIKVKDPVSGKELVSDKAQQRYEFKGRTYFFESEETMEKFKAAPESYSGDRESRYYRVQGYKGA